MEGSQTNIEDAVRKEGEIKEDGQIVPGRVTSTTNTVWIWDTRSYEKIPVLDYMLTNKIRQRRPDGSYQFTMNDPGKLPIKGHVKCTLHPENPNRQHFDELGFPVCNKPNIKNQHELMMHMKRKHGQEWETLEEERKKREREEDRELQRTIIAQASRHIEISDDVADTPLEEGKPTETKRKYAKRT